MARVHPADLVRDPVHRLVERREDHVERDGVDRDRRPRRERAGEIARAAGGEQRGRAGEDPDGGIGDRPRGRAQPGAIDADRLDGRGHRAAGVTRLPSRRQIVLPGCGSGGTGSHDRRGVTLGRECRSLDVHAARADGDSGTVRACRGRGPDRVSLGVGLLVGLEREWAHKEVGVRTFSIIALLGALTSLLDGPLVVTALVGAFLLVAFLNVQSLLRDRSLELTTSAALIVTLVLGALAAAGHFFTAVASAIAVTMLLAWKVGAVPLRGRPPPEEIRSAVLLGLLSLVVQPLLPDRVLDPWALVNPRQAWVVVAGDRRARLRQLLAPAALRCPRRILRGVPRRAREQHRGGRRADGAVRALDGQRRARRVAPPADQRRDVRPQRSPSSRSSRRPSSASGGPAARADDLRVLPWLWPRANHAKRPRRSSELSSPLSLRHVLGVRRGVRRRSPPPAPSCSATSVAPASSP